MKTVTFDAVALEGLDFAVPPDPISADLGEGPAYTVHLLPNQVECREVLFVAKGYPMDDEGYWIHIERLRREPRWVTHLSEKITEDGCRPAVVMLAEAFARKRRG
jgi:hypothetical protein